MGKNLRLADYEVGGGLFRTLQGYGLLLGVPTVFLRLYGCDFSCSFCDSKGTWKEGSTFTEVSVEEMAERLSKVPETWVSITGGNPLLQADAVVGLINLLPNKKFIVETQGSVHHPEFYQSIHFASFSPKLHDLRLSVMAESFRTLRVRETPTQVSVVVTSDGEVHRALDTMEEIRRLWCLNPKTVYEPRLPVFYLLPEFKTGRAGVQTAMRVLQERMADGLDLEVRVLPQVHKLALFVP